MSLLFLFYKNTFLWYHSFGYFLFVFLMQCCFHFDVFCNNQHFSIVKIYMSNFHFVRFSIYLIWTRFFFVYDLFFFHFTLNHCNFSGFSTPLCLRHDDWPLSLQILFFIVFIESNPHKRWKWHRRWWTIKMKEKKLK